jgi:large subunit ribosomal protein L31
MHVTARRLLLCRRYPRRNSVTQHPDLHLVDVRCSACGASYVIRSTAERVSVDVCSNCHPAYTGRARTLASSDRIERFNRRRTLAAA